MKDAPTDALKRELIRLVHARTDIRCAAALAEELLARGDDGSNLVWGILTGLTVSYARPFTRSDSGLHLGKKWARFPEDTDLQRHHDRLIEYRNRLLAHNDASPHREVEIWPAGHMLDEPVVMEARAAIDLCGIAAMPRLFEYQEERMNEVQRAILNELQARERWPPDREVRLRIDDLGQGSDDKHQVRAGSPQKNGSQKIGR